MTVLNRKIFYKAVKFHVLASEKNGLFQICRVASKQFCIWFASFVKASWSKQFPADVHSKHIPTFHKPSEILGSKS